MHIKPFTSLPDVPLTGKRDPHPRAESSTKRPRAASGSPSSSPPGQKKRRAPHNRCSREALDLLCTPFSLEDTEIEHVNGGAGGRLGIGKSLVRESALRDRLDTVLGLRGYEERYTLMFKRGVFIAECRLVICGAERTGYGADRVPDRAREDAFRRACARFGIGRNVEQSPAVMERYEFKAANLEEIEASLAAQSGKVPPRPWRR